MTSGPGRSSRWRSLRHAVPLLALMVGTSACDPSFGYPKNITAQGERMRHLWIGSSIAAAVVGGFVVVLMLITMIRDRRRDDVLPPQVRYNLPIEMLYTVVPFVIIAALFFYTARDEVYVMKTTAAPAAHGVSVIDVEGFQWGWTFRYLDDSGKVGVPQGDAVFVTGSSNTTEPTLVLPANTPVQFQEHSDNVIHSFWVPALLFKEDVIPGRTNTWEISGITRQGTFRGHCAELCGDDHARMNFEVKVVSPAEFQQFLMQKKADGQTAPVPDWVLKTTPVGSFS